MSGNDFGGDTGLRPAFVGQIGIADTRIAARPIEVRVELRLSVTDHQHDESGSQIILVSLE